MSGRDQWTREHMVTDGKGQAASVLGNFLRRLVLPRSMKTWTMTTLREKLIKIGAKVVRHAKYVTFHMAEVAVGYRLYRAMEVK